MFFIHFQPVYVHFNCQFHVLKLRLLECHFTVMSERHQEISCQLRSVEVRAFAILD